MYTEPFLGYTAGPGTEPAPSRGMGDAGHRPQGGEAAGGAALWQVDGWGLGWGADNGPSQQWGMPLPLAGGHDIPPAGMVATELSPWDLWLRVLAQ